MKAAQKAEQNSKKKQQTSLEEFTQHQMYKTSTETENKMHNS